jgi:hypothetical protein
MGEAGRAPNIGLQRPARGDPTVRWPRRWPSPHLRLRKPPPCGGRGDVDGAIASAGAPSSSTSAEGRRSPMVSVASKRSTSAKPARSRRKKRPLRALRSLTLRAPMTSPAKDNAPTSPIYFKLKNMTWKIQSLPARCLILRHYGVNRRSGAASRPRGRREADALDVWR